MLITKTKKHKKLCSISPTKQFRRQENNLSKKPSNTNTTNNYKKQKINELQEKINKLKHQEIADEQLAKAETTHKITCLSQAILRSVNTASGTNRGQQENIVLITVINFVKQTMTTLSKYGEQLKTQLDFNLIQQAI